jgi:hypothetical protein
MKKNVIDALTAVITIISCFIYNDGHLTYFSFFSTILRLRLYSVQHPLSLIPLYCISAIVSKLYLLYGIQKQQLTINKNAKIFQNNLC